jgi:PhnB protein
MPSDPLSSLRLPVSPVSPRAEFADALRRSLEKELAMSATSTRTGPGLATTVDVRLLAYLCCDGAARAIDFYVRAFGAMEVTRMEEEATGRIGHAELTIGGVTVMLADEYPEIGVVSPTTLGGTPVALYLQVDDVDAWYERAMAAGATSLRAPEDQFHGNRTATVSDPFGHRWMLSSPTEELSIDELASRAADEGYDASTGTAPADDD